MATNRQVESYSGLVGFQGSVRDVRKNAGAHKTSAIWALILNFVFPVTEGYIHEPESRNAGGFSDITSVRWTVNPNTNKPRKRSFLVTQTKGPGTEDSPATWEKAEKQLHRYVSRLSSNPKYGIVAVGKVVKFYRWSTGGRALVFLPNNTDEYFHVVNDEDQIRRLLYRIKHGLN